MLTIEKLREFGANVDEGVKRCVNNETFYLTMVTKSLQEPGFDNLKGAIEAGDLDKAFEIAHALKGVTGNLALTPIDTPVREITELLRSHTDMDYGPLVSEILTKKNELAALL